MRLNRREFCTLGLAAPALLAQPAAPLIDRGFASVSQLASGVWVTIANPRKGLQALSNGGVIAGRDGVLLVEGHCQPPAAALEADAAAMVSRAPILAAMNTHYHYDHSLGNQAYADRRIPILAHQRSPGLMKERYAALKGVDKTKLTAPLKTRIAETADPVAKKRLEGDLEFDQLMYWAIDSAPIAYPTELMSASTRTIDLGGIDVVIEAHPGHTPTDLIVRIPDRDIVFTGDLLFYRSYPVCFDADMVAWRRILQMFVGYGNRMRFIPGHGPVCGLDAVRDHLDLMDDLRSQAEKMKRAGIALDEARHRYVIPARFENFDSTGWSATIGAAIERYYR